MKNETNQKDLNNSTCKRLLDAAETLFCQKGYDNTSVRDITAEAGCNIAAVNYHFGGKKQLYQEMFRRRVADNFELHFQTIERICSQANPTLEDLLRALVTPPLESVEKKDPWVVVVRMMVRESLNQRLDIEKIIGEIKSRFFDRLSQAFLQLIDGMDPQDAQKAVLSIDSLVLHPMLFMEYYTFLMPGLTTQDVIEQIVRFGAAGIRGSIKE